VCKASPKIDRPLPPAWPDGQSTVLLQVDLIYGSHLLYAQDFKALDTKPAPNVQSVTIRFPKYDARITVSRFPADLTETTTIELLHNGGPWYTASVGPYEPRQIKNYDSGLLALGPTAYPFAVKVRMRA